MAYEFNRNIQDAAFTSTVAIASAGANTASFDLEQVTGGDVEKVVFELSCPLAASITAGTYTYKLSDSSDNSSFTAVDPLTSTTQVFVSGTGLPAKTVRFRLPPVTKRYVRIEQTASGSTGTVGGSMVAKLLF
jgi:hypothetical protein